MIAAKPKLKILAGANRREHVVLPEELEKYLAAATEPLRSVATVLVDSGLRHEECFLLRWENVMWQTGKFGGMQVQHGKSAAARRAVPMPPHVRGILAARWQAAGQPEVGYVWPAAKASLGHIVPNSIYEPHRHAIKESGVRPFVLYSLRHPFLTRLGATGVDAWTLARIAGVMAASRFRRTACTRRTFTAPWMDWRPGARLATGREN
jgi:integrase